MPHDDIKQSIHDAFDDEPEEVTAPPVPGSGNPALPIASLVVSLAGLVLGVIASWILSVAAGIAAIVLGLRARKKASPRLGLAYAGIALGVLNIMGSAVLVVLFLQRLSSLGLL